MTCTTTVKYKFPVNILSMYQYIVICNILNIYIYKETKVHELEKEKREGKKIKWKIIILYMQKLRYKLYILNSTSNSEFLKSFYKLNETTVSAFSNWQKSKNPKRSFWW